MLAATADTERGLTLLANRIKGMGQGAGATVEIVLAEVNGQRILVAGLNSSATWSNAQLSELASLGINVAPQQEPRRTDGPHAEQNMAACLKAIGGRGIRWSRAVVGEPPPGGSKSYVCKGCQDQIRLVGGVIEPGR